LRWAFAIAIGLVLSTGVPASALPAHVSDKVTITWIDSPRYAYDPSTGWMSINSRFKAKSLKPITDGTQVLISVRGPRFISAGLAAPGSQDGIWPNRYHYRTAFPAPNFPPAGRYRVNSVCRGDGNGHMHCRAANKSEAVEVVIPPHPEFEEYKPSPCHC
jgi:hypothetical protein